MGLRRRYGVAAGIAAGAIAAAGVGVVSGTTSHAAAASLASPIATAPYFVTPAFMPDPAPVLVTNAGTGRSVTVKPPAGRTFTQVAAARNDRTFALAAASTSGSKRVAFYRLQLTAAGHEQSLRVLPVTEPSSFQGTVALSANGAKLAIASLGSSHGSSDATVTVVTLASGAHHSWSAPSGAVTTLTWAGNKNLGVDWASVAATSRWSGLRVLNTTSSGSNLLASSRLAVSAQAKLGGFSGIQSPLLPANGRTLYATMESSGSVRTEEVVEFSMATGHPVKAVTPRADESGMGSFCGAVWTSASGQQAAAVCGTPGGEGTISHGVFTKANLHISDYNDSTPRSTFIAW